ncbi:MAG TPA: PC4/YdbC family ssDNA-binding protein [Stellaceae bacterium]|nr:PC4/YdbC family ssDNA-binding protein [Stellaceae bacterium]
MTPVEIPKNKQEVLRLSFGEYRDRMLLNARVWYRNAEGEELKPGKDGWAISIEKLPEIVAGLQGLEAEARAAGFLK